MSNSRDLVVIEAPGKLRAVYRDFEVLGIAVDVVATIGHIYENPAHLDRVGVVFRDGELIETDRLPQRPDSFAYLQQCISRCSGRILIATDDDQEGHVIAQDVTDLVTKLMVSVPVLRVCPHALSPQGWKLAMGKARPIDPAKAMAGTARRIADRLIAATFSDLSKHRVVGRVQSALIGLSEAHGIPSREIRVQCGASDNGAPFVGRGVIAADEDVFSFDDLLSCSPLDVASAATEPCQRPMHGGDAVLALHDQLAISIRDASDLLQDMYEAGEISYPRSASQGLRADGVAAIAMLARAKSVRNFRAELLPRLDEDLGSSHQAVHLTMGAMVDRLDLGRPLRLFRDTREAAAAVIGRHTIESGIALHKERPVLAALPAWARSLEWSRDGRLPAMPWRHASPPADRPLDCAAAVVHAQIRYGLGRPSTWVSHACRMVDTRWMNERGQLTLRGRMHADGVPPILRDPATSVAIEAILENPNLSVLERVTGALRLSMGGNESAAAALIESLSSESVYETPTFSY